MTYLLITMNTNLPIANSYTYMGIFNPGVLSLGMLALGVLGLGVLDLGM